MSFTLFKSFFSKVKLIFGSIISGDVVGGDKITNNFTQLGFYKPLESNYLNTGFLEGGNDFFQRSYLYSTQNKNYFFDRDIENEMLSCLEPLQKNIILLNGESGSGKTTIIRKVIEKLLDNKRIVYILDKGIYSSKQDKSEVEKIINTIEQVDSRDNAILIIDKVSFDDYNNNDVVKKIFDFILKEGKCHLLFAPLRSPNDKLKDKIENDFVQSMTNSNFNEYKIFDSDQYTQNENYTLLNIHSLKFPTSNNINEIKILLNQKKPLPFISSLVFFNQELDEILQKHLIHTKNIEVYENISINDMMGMIYLFSRHGEKLWLNDIGRDKLQKLKEYFYFSLTDDHIKGISEYYDDKFFSIIVQDTDALEKIIENIIVFFNQINPLLQFYRKEKFILQEKFEILIYRHLDIVLPKANIYDLTAIKNIITKSKFLNSIQQTEYIQAIVFALLKLEISDYKAFQKLVTLFREIKDILDDESLNDIDFDIKCYFNELGHLHLSRVLDDLSSSGYKKNIAHYILSEGFEVKINNQVITNIFLDSKDSINQLPIKNIVDSYYNKLESLKHIEAKAFFTLFKMLVIANNKMFIEINYKLENIFDYLLQNYKFDSYSFKKISIALLKKEIYINKYIDVRKLIDLKLKSDYVIWEFLSSNNLISDDDIPILIEYFNKYYKGHNPFVVVQFLSCYSQENREKFYDKNITELFSWVLNIVKKQLDVILVKKDSTFIKPSSTIGKLLRNEDIATNIIIDNNAVALAQKLINLYLLVDWNKNKIYNNNLKFKKYNKLLECFTDDLYRMLYAEHKVFVYQKDLHQYIKYAKKQKINGVYLDYIDSHFRYERQNELSYSMFYILGKFYLENKEILKFPKNIVANILKSTQYRTKFNEIQQLFLDGYNMETDIYLKEKNIIDLANYYLEMKEFTICSNFINEYLNLITTKMNKKHLENIKRNVQSAFARGNNKQ